MGKTLAMMMAFGLTLTAAMAGAATTENKAASTELPDAPAPIARAPLPRGQARPEGLRAFSKLGFDVKMGLGGAGFDVATPLGKHFNLRSGASFFNFDLSKLNLVEDGFAIEGTLKMQSVNTCIDMYPMGDSFRISPGVTWNNGNDFTGKGLIPPGGTIDLNDATYTSSSTDPLVATFSTPGHRFGHKVAPTLTMGVGSVLPRGEGKHWSVPVELGMEYIAPPKLVLGLTGSACNAQGCASAATDPAIQANVRAQQETLNQDIYNLRFFPIFSIGIGYKF